MDNHSGVSMFVPCCRVVSSRKNNVNTQYRQVKREEGMTTLEP